MYGVGIEPANDLLEGQIGFTQSPQVNLGLFFHFLSLCNYLNSL